MSNTHVNSEFSSVEDSSYKNQLKLFGFGFIILFLELSLIRYLAGNVWNLGYFPNLVLISTFLGMGAGFTFHHRFSLKSANMFVLYAALFVLALISIVTTSQLVVPGFSESQSDYGNILFFTQTMVKTNLWLDFSFFILIFALVILVNFLLAVKMAKLFKRFKPLHAYSLDILGSCVGILVFSLLSYCQAPAFTWFILAGLVLLSLSYSQKQRGINAVLLLVVVFICVISYLDGHSFAGKYVSADKISTIWSPYQKIQFNHQKTTVYANNIPHQVIEKSSASIAKSFYSIPYLMRKKMDLPPAESTLILGAGTGNDVSAAILHNVKHVDAVEIDPVIAKLGEKYNKENPYQNPAVSLHINDGRAFLARTKRQYDIVIFALTDSVVRASSLSQLRLENYLFTYQSVKSAYDHLSANGQLYFYNYYRQPWIAGKIQSMLHKATGHYPKVLKLSSDFFVISIGKAPGTYQSTPTFRQLGLKIPTDNWPFFYMQHPAVPEVYFIPMLLLALIVVGLLFFHQRNTKNLPRESMFTKLSFLMMGMAFLLLETKGVIQFSLLFGNTWFNNSLVFFAVLFLILIANWLAYLLPSKLILWAYLALIVVSITVGCFSIEPLLEIASVWTRFIYASLIIFSPVFFANLVFGLSFKKRIVAEHVFGWNLLGAVFGGILEYSSMLFGYQTLSFTAAALYILSFAFLYIGLKRRFSV